MPLFHKPDWFQVQKIPKNKCEKCNTANADIFMISYKGHSIGYKCRRCGWLWTFGEEWKFDRP